MQMPLDTLTSNARLTLCSRCRHSEFIHSDESAHGDDGGPCLFNACKCWRFVPEREPRTEAA
jgi:hypothetical protein